MRWPLVETLPSISTGKVHDFGLEQWPTLKRAQRIRNAVSAKLMITIFGFMKEDTSSSEKPARRPIGLDQPEISEARERMSQQSSHQQAVARASGVSQNEICEGWAPPPVASHGAKFRDLTSQEKSDLRKLQINLGHPDPHVLAEHLKAQQAAPHVVAAAQDFVCDACVESVGWKHQRPAKLHDPKDFNDTVGIDGFYWYRTPGIQSSRFSLHWWGLSFPCRPKMWDPKPRSSNHNMDKLLDFMGRESKSGLHWSSWRVHFTGMERSQCGVTPSSHWFPQKLGNVVESKDIARSSNACCLDAI